jgi:hypothetical protein
LLAKWNKTLLELTWANNLEEIVEIQTRKKEVQLELKKAHTDCDKADAEYNKIKGKK